MNRLIPPLALFLLIGFSTRVAAQDATADKMVVETETVDLGQYVGAYGPRSITLENDRLFYMREGMPQSVALAPTGIDTFEVVIPPGAQVRGPGGDHVIPAFVFKRDESGKVTELVMVNPDGTVVGTAPRSDSK